MTFLNPTIAAVGLACIAIPIIIHILMRRRRRPVPWGAMRFLMEAYRRQRRRMNLEQVLLLATRCLLVALLAMALGKPVLGAIGALAQGPRTLYLLIDNGVAAGAVVPGQTETALDRSKAAALDLLSQLDQSQGDRVAILSLAAPANPVVVPPTSDLSAAGELVRALKPLDSRTDIPGALLKIRDELRRVPLKRGESLWVGLLSDLRAGSAELESTLPGLAQSEGETHLLAQSPAASPLDNVAITSVEPARSVIIAPDAGASSTASTPVRVHLRRSGPGVSASAVTTITIEGVAVSASGPPTSRGPRAQTAVTWSPGQDTATAYLTVEVPVQALRAPVALVATIDEDAIAADNIYRRPIDTRERLEVALLVQGAVGGRNSIEAFTPGDWLALALAPEADPMRRRQSGEIRVSALDPARALAPLPGSRSPAGMLGDYDAILIPRPDKVDAAGWRLVRAAADLGALIVIYPPPSEQTHTWTDAMTEGLGLEWTIAREARVYNPGALLLPDRPTPSGPDLLEQLAAELPELIKHIHVTRALPIEGPPGSFEPLLTLADGSPLLVMAQPGASEKSSRASRGMVLFFTAAPDLKWTDLPTKPLMVPLIQELVRQGVGRSAGPRTAVAGSAPMLMPGAAELALLPDASGASATPVGVDMAGRPSQPVRTQGLYVARASSGVTAGVLAFNADASGTLTDTRTREELARWLTPVANDLTWLEPGSDALSPGGEAGSATAALSRDSKLPPISFPLLIAALMLAVVETFIARWFSHARAESGLLRARESAAAAEEAAA